MFANLTVDLTILASLVDVSHGDDVMLDVWDVFAALQGTFLLQRLQVGIPRTLPSSSFR